MQFVLSGNVPSKKNSKQIICRGRRPMLLSSKNHQEWHEIASYELLAQKRPKNPVQQAEISLTFYAKDKRAFDLSNKAESIMDLLVDMLIIEDDNCYVINKLTLTFGGVDKDNPRTIILIEPKS